jgi:hypothetical protein
MALPFMIITASASCVLGLIIGSKYPEAVSVGYNTIASKMWSTVCETTSTIYAKVIESIPKPEIQAKTD